MRRLLALLIVTALAVSFAPTASSAPRERRLPANPGLFLNVLPGGQGTTTTSADALQYELTGAVPLHDVDQQQMYDSLLAADLSSLSNADLSH
jgi:hypothetical protein